MPTSTIGSSPPPAGTPDVDAEPTSERFKRLAKAVNASKRQRRKIKEGESPAEESDPLRLFKKQARWIGRSVNPVVHLNTLMGHGFAFDAVDAEAAASGNPPEVPEVPILQEMTEAERQRERDIYKRVLATLPSLDLYLSDFEANPVSMNDFFGMLDNVKNQSRADDLGSLQKVFDRIMERAVLEDEKSQWEKNKDKYRANKSSRGFNDTIFGRLLCPHRLSGEFAKNPQDFCKTVRAVSSTYPITANAFPSFLYDRPFNTENIGDGLLRGKLPILCFKAMFTSPSSVADESGEVGRHSVAEIYGCTRVSIYLIAYSCMLARFMCGSLMRWSAREGKFYYFDFYYCILQLLDDPDDDWVIGVLDYWDAKIFHRGPRRGEAALVDAAEASGLTSDMRQFKEQRAAQKAAAAKAAAEKAAAEKAAAERAAAAEEARLAALEKDAFGGSDDEGPSDVDDGDNRSEDNEEVASDHRPSPSPSPQPAAVGHKRAKGRATATPAPKAKRTRRNA